MNSATEHLLDVESPYVGYAYSYPHKSAYRTLEEPVHLQALWAQERRDALFLYLHVPFCEYRCGFCNLFTLANAEPGWAQQYMDQLQREANAVKGCLGQAKFSRFAIGGGTPTFLDEQRLEQLLDIASNLLGGDGRDIPTSCEASPATLTPRKAQLLRAWGIDRLSLGVQSFNDKEASLLGRPQKVRDVEQAIEVVHDCAFPVLNLDLIYGAEGQSSEAWMDNVRRAISYRPEEIYLYPLYVRELTGLGRTSATASDDRLDRYREARDALLDSGYEQVSMRMFRLPSQSIDAAPVYCCQSDGMVGLGCGARSYTRDLHYSTEFAVGKSGVRAILQDYLSRECESFRFASHGYVLGELEQRRRYVIQGLLQVEGVHLDNYRERFGESIWEHLPQLEELVERNWATESDRILRLTPAGMERSDVIGPWLYSDRVRGLMEEFECL